jgi:hypothetical protein
MSPDVGHKADLFDPSINVCFWGAVSTGRRNTLSLEGKDGVWDGAAIVAGSEASEMFEAVEAALDTVSEFVDAGVMRDDDFSGSVRGDHGGGPHAGDERAQGITVIGFVSKHGPGGLTFEQDRRGCDVANLTGGNDDPHRTAKTVGEHVDFGGQSASGTLSPPRRSAPSYRKTRPVLISVGAHRLRQPEQSAAARRVREYDHFDSGPKTQLLFASRLVARRPYLFFAHLFGVCVEPGYRPIHLP